jgi:uncharacterized membrane protein (UPF0127 family)
MPSPRATKKALRSAPFAWADNALRRRPMRVIIAAMKVVQVVNETRDTIVCPKCSIADGFLTRVRGLMWRADLPADEGLWIIPCPSIHMFNMKFAIDAIFLTADGTVTDIVEGIKPGKTYVAKANQGNAHSTVEVAVGTVGRSGTQIGDKLVSSVLVLKP